MAAPLLSRAGGSLCATIAVLSLITVTGCRSPAKTTGGAAPNPAAPAAAATPAGRYKVTAATTPFFRLGPQQPNGPDLALKQGTRITLLRRGFGYSQVQLEDGTAGFVGTEDVARLTPEEIAAETKPLLPAANPLPGAKPGTAARRRLGRPGPNFPIAPPDEPGLPAAPDPTPRAGPVPSFRY